MTEQRIDENDTPEPLTVVRTETVADIEKELDDLNSAIAQLEKDSIANKRHASHIDGLLRIYGKDKEKIQRRLANAPWTAD